MAPKAKYSPKRQSAAAAAEGDRSQLHSSSNATGTTHSSTSAHQSLSQTSSAMKASERRRARHAAYSSAAEEDSSPANTHSACGVPKGGSSNSGSDGERMNQAYSSSSRSTGTSNAVEGRDGGTSRSGDVAAVHSAIGAVSPPSSSSSGGARLATSVAAELGVSSATPKHRSGALDRARARSARRQDAAAAAAVTAAATSTTPSKPTTAERDDLPALELRVPSSFGVDTETSDASMISGVTGFTASTATTSSSPTRRQMQSSHAQTAGQQKSVAMGTTPSPSLFRVAAQSSGAVGISGTSSRSEGGIKLSVRRSGKQTSAAKAVHQPGKKASAAKSAAPTTDTTGTAEQPPILPSASREDMASTIASVIGHAPPTASASPLASASASRDGAASTVVTPTERGMSSPPATARQVEYVTTSPKHNSHIISSPKPRTTVPVSPSSTTSPLGRTSVMDVLRSATSSKASPDADVGGVSRELKYLQPRPQQRSITQRGQQQQGDMHLGAKVTNQESSPLQFMRSATASKASPGGVAQRPALSPSSSPPLTSRPVGASAVPAMATQMVAQAVHRDPKSSGGRSPPRSPQQEFLMSAFASSILFPGGPKLPNLHAKEAGTSPPIADDTGAGLLLARKRQGDIQPSVNEGVEVGISTGAASNISKTPVSSSSHVCSSSNKGDTRRVHRDETERSKSIEITSSTGEDAAAAIDEIRSLDAEPEYSSNTDHVEGRKVDPNAIASVGTYFDSVLTKGHDYKLSPSTEVVVAARRDTDVLAKEGGSDRTEAPVLEDIKDETKREVEAAVNVKKETKELKAALKVNEDGANSAAIVRANEETTKTESSSPEKKNGIALKGQKADAVQNRSFLIDDDAFVLDLEAIAKAENNAIKTFESLLEAEKIGDSSLKEDTGTNRKVTENTEAPPADDAGNPSPHTEAADVDDSGNDNGIMGIDAMPASDKDDGISGKSIDNDTEDNASKDLSYPESISPVAAHDNALRCESCEGVEAETNGTEPSQPEPVPSTMASVDASQPGGSSKSSFHEPSESNELGHGIESTAALAIKEYKRHHAPAAGLSPGEEENLEAYTHRAAKLIGSKVPIKDAAKQILRSSRKDSVPDQMIIQIFQSLKAVEDNANSSGGVDPDMEQITSTESAPTEEDTAKVEESLSSDNKVNTGREESLPTGDEKAKGQQNTQVPQSQIIDSKVDALPTESSSAEAIARTHKQQDEDASPGIESASSDESYDRYARIAEPENYDSDVSDIPRRQTVAEMRNVNDGDMEVYLMEEEVVEVAYVDEDEEMRATEKSRAKINRVAPEDTESNDVTSAGALDTSSAAKCQAKDENSKDEQVSPSPPLAPQVEPMSQLQEMINKRDRLILGERMFQEVDPGFLGGVAAAAAIATRSPRKKKLANRRKRGIRHSTRPLWRQSYEERTRGHTGYFTVDFYSLSDSTAMVNRETHRLDDVPWEHRDVKQRFLYEKSVSFTRNWFGSATPTRGNDRNFEPVCHPKSMLMQMERLPAPGEWPEDWFTSWKSRKENPNALVTDKDERRAGGPSITTYKRAPSQSKEGVADATSARDKYAFEDDSASFSDAGEDAGYRSGGASWVEPNEMGTLCTVRYKAGEPKSRVNWFLTSRLRRSRWRKKYFPRGLPYD